MVSTPPLSPTKKPADQTQANGDGAASSKVVQQKPDKQENNQQIMFYAADILDSILRTLER